MDYILSVDPGQHGFLCLSKVDKEYTPVEFFPMPTKQIKVGKKKRTKVDEDKLSTIISKLKESYKLKTIIIEKQQVISSKENQQGISSSASILEHFGYLKGLADGYQLNRVLVAAKTWQTIYPDTISKDLETKEKSKLYCSQLFPHIDLRKNTRCSKQHDGKTDSILIGYWYYSNEYRTI